MNYADRPYELLWPFIDYLMPVSFYLFFFCPIIKLTKKKKFSILILDKNIQASEFMKIINQSAELKALQNSVLESNKLNSECYYSAMDLD